MKIIKSLLSMFLFAVSLLLGIYMVNDVSPLSANAVGLETYSVVYNLNDGVNNLNNPTTYTNQQKFFFGIPTRDGYSFGGWYTTSTFDTNTIVTTAPELANDGDILTLYAKWTAAPKLSILSAASSTPTEYATSAARVEMNPTTLTSVQLGLAHFKTVDINGNGNVDIIYSKVVSNLATFYAYDPILNSSITLGEIAVNATFNVELVADLNGDGSLDLVAQYGTDMYIVPSLDFSKTTVVAMGITANTFKELLLGDIDGDGLDDIFVKSINTSYVVPGITVFSIAIDSSLVVTATNSVSQWIGNNIYNFDIYDLNDDGITEIITLQQYAVGVYQYSSANGYQNVGTFGGLSILSRRQIKVGRFFGGTKNYVIFSASNPYNSEQIVLNSLSFNGLSVNQGFFSGLEAARPNYGPNWDSIEISRFNDQGQYYLSWRSINDSNSKSFRISSRVSSGSSWTNTYTQDFTYSTYSPSVESENYYVGNTFYRVDGGLSTTGYASYFSTSNQPTYSLGYTPSLSVTGYSVYGYYDNAAFTGAGINLSTFAVTQDTTVYAKLTANTIYVNWNTNGGNYIPQVTSAYGQTVSEPTAPTRVGYTFGGWYSDYSLSTAFDYSTPLATTNSSITIYAKWTAINYTISYEEDGGVNSNDTAITDQTAAYGTYVVLPLSPKKTGYTFLGWFTDSAFTNSASSSLYVYQDTTLYAKWSINQYVIAYNTNQGTSVDSLTATYGDSITAPTAPTRVGYNFAGWYSDMGLQTEYAFTTMPAANTTLYAKWLPTMYTMTFESNGGPSVSPGTTYIGLPAHDIDDISRYGYNFLGWFYDAALTQPITGTSMPAGDVTLYAKWELAQFEIEFESNGGSSVDSILDDYQSSITQPANPTRLGYTFGGWFSESSLTNTYSFSTMPGENLTLYAKWTINRYTITVNTNGGSSIAAIEADYDDEVSTPSQPTKEGHTFAGYYSDSALTSPYVFDAMPAENITVYVKWTINQYTISFNAAGGSETSTINADFGQAVTPPANPTRSGYIFNGWNQPIPTTIPSQDVVLTATWLRVTQPQVSSGVSAEGLLDAIDEELYANKDVTILLNAEVVVDTSIQESVLQIIADYIASDLDYSNEGLVYLDIEVLLQEGANTTVLSTVSGPITFTIAIPEESQGFKNYQIIRIHNGVAEVIDSTYDEEAQNITFETDKFSTFTIIYETSSFNWWWLLLLLIIPAAYAIYHYRDEIKQYYLEKKATVQSKLAKSK